MYFKEQDMDINRNNCETFFLLYLDRELNPSEMSGVEKFLSENADLQREFSLLQQTILIPSQAIFDQKELLFRKEEKRRAIPMYWTRIAAAVAVLFFSGWLITTQLLKKQANGIAGSFAEKKVVPAKANISDQKIKDANSRESDLSEATVNKTQTVVQQNTKSTKNQLPVNAGITKNRLTTKNDLSGENNQTPSLTSSTPDLQNTSSGEDPGGSNLAMQKSSKQELQTVESQKDADPKEISALPGSHSPVVLIAAAGVTENVPHVRDENAMLRENEDQPDNAISVVALNDRNKGITGFFKKLTRRAPTNENARTVRVSVFQFSY
jgi:hypothetical protein